MTNRTRAWIAAAIIVIVIVAFAVWKYTQNALPFPVSASDHLTNWALPLPQDAASSTPRLSAQVSQFQAMLGGGTYPNETIYVGIANDDILLGDGKAAYLAYEKAIAASSSDALAYDDLGGLFARLYATSSAERAYAKAVALTPSQLLFQLSYLDYLAEVAPNAPATAAAFVSAKQVLGTTTPDLLVAEANWLAESGSTTAAIADWQEVLVLEPGLQVSIQERINALKQ
jgi:tetratricopeptide (TPR) repeat protein